MSEVAAVRDLAAGVLPPDEGAMARARERQGRLTKPPGSLGRLEALSVRLAGIVGTERPEIRGKAVVVCAADHGVAAEGVSAYPPAVTAAMVANFLAGGAAVSAIARTVGARVLVLDAGVDAELPPHPDLIAAKVRRGSANIAREPAMSRPEAARAVLAGAAAARRAISGGATLLAAGDMGIANTTPSAALTAWFTGRPARDVTGRGTGVDDAALERKVWVVERALSRAAGAGLGPGDALGALAELGGLEIGAMAGVMLAGAAADVPVVVDGFIAGAAALVATGLAPALPGRLLASHRGAEPGHAVQLEALGLEPLLDLGLRLGEGTGALLAMPLIEAAARTLSEMATFGEANVPGPA